MLWAQGCKMAGCGLPGWQAPTSMLRPPCGRVCAASSKPHCAACSLQAFPAVMVLRCCCCVMCFCTGKGSVETERQDTAAAAPAAGLLAAQPPVPHLHEEHSQVREGFCTVAVPLLACFYSSGCASSRWGDSCGGGQGACAACTPSKRVFYGAISSPRPLYCCCHPPLPQGQAWQRLGGL